MIAASTTLFGDRVFVHIGTLPSPLKKVSFSLASGVARYLEGDQ